MTRARRLLAAALVASALAIGATSCAPFAHLARNLLDTSDGATLTFRQRTPEHASGVLFDPAGRPARAVIVIATGEAIELLAFPEDAACTATATRLDCRLGDVDEPTAIDLTGRNVIASATYRRDGSNTVHQAFAR